MSEHDLMRIRRVGDRLRAGLRTLVDGFPPSARNISGMARWLGVHKATCQRIVEGLDPGRDGLTAFSRFPGTEGIRTHIAAAHAKGVGSDRLDAASAAVEEYESLLATYGHTQRGLVRIIESLRIEAAGPEGQPDRELAEDQRKALFDGAKRVTGEEMRGKGLVAIIRPRPDQPSRLVGTFFTHLVGVRRHSFSRPIVSFIYSGFWSHGDEVRPTRVAEEHLPCQLVQAFSTAGLKTVKIDARDARTLAVVDLDSVPTDGEGFGPADACVKFSSVAVPNPLWEDITRLNVATRIANPSRAMVMDVYLHHSIAASVVPVVASYSLAAPPGDSPEGAPDQCWYERFPDSPELLQLGRATEARPRAILPRHEDLVQYAFQDERLDPAEYLGYRCEAAYPIWQSEYRLYFEVPRPEAPE
jgi:hypothetical protein